MEKSTPMMTHLDELFSLPFLAKFLPFSLNGGTEFPFSRTWKFECSGAFISNAKNEQLRPRSLSPSRSRPLRTLYSHTTR